MRNLIKITIAVVPNMRTFSFLLLFLMFSCPALSEVYKWTDADGKVRYSDRPIPEGKSTAVNIAKPPPANPEAEIKLKQMRYQFERTKETKEEKAIAEEKAASKRQERCSDSRTRLRNLLEAGPVYVNKDDKRVYLTDKQKDDAIALEKENTKEFCD